MKEHRFAFLLEHRNYRLAGHGCNQPPGTPSTSGLGGSAEANFRASQDDELTTKKCSAAASAASGRGLGEFPRPPPQGGRSGRPTLGYCFGGAEDIAAGGGSGCSDLMSVCSFARASV